MIKRRQGCGFGDGEEGNAFSKRFWRLKQSVFSSSLNLEREEYLLGAY